MPEHTKTQENSKEIISENDQIAIRKAKRKEIILSGQEAYPVKIPEITPIEQVRKNWDGKLEIGQETDETVCVAGRIMFLRNTGKLCFASLQSGSGVQLQVMLSLNEVGQESLDRFKQLVDLNDIIFVKGKIISSKRGELSVLASFWNFAAKSLRPLPTLYKELNEENRIRNRSIDLISNEKARKIAFTRVQVMLILRKYMQEKGFLEIETPMLQTIHGGAAARPFKTHMNDYGFDLFLRIAPELFLKRAAVGGFDRVFEINRNFRNEGMDSSHAPEFSMMEAYQAYGDYNTMQDLVQQMILEVVKFINNNNLKVELVNGSTYDFGGKWEQITVYESLSNAANKNITPETTIDELKKIAKENNLEIHPSHQTTHGKLVEVIFEELVARKLYNPTFVRDFPAETSPLTRPDPKNPKIAQKWDLYVRGMELATAYSELVDPVIQREKFQAQANLGKQGDQEAMPLDEDFLNAMELGLPPTGGMGMGIDRLLMAITGLGIRETILFPLVKPL